MKVRELVKQLMDYDMDEDIELVVYDTEHNDDYVWTTIDRVERFIPDDETSPLTIVSGEIVG